MSIALVAAQAAVAGGARAPAARRCSARAKSVSADLVTDADAAAEARRGRRHPRAPAARRDPRRGGGDAAPGRAPAAGSSTPSTALSRSPATCPAAGAAPSRSRTSTARSPPRSSTRSASSTPPLAARARRSTASPRAAEPRGRCTPPTSPPSCARTASSHPASAQSAHALLDRTGLIRHAGPGSLELAWVAAGRLDAWVQPETDPWDWLPGALLVTEAGGVARIVEASDALARRRPVSPR